MSKMSRLKRRKLETRLKDELEQVRALQRKIYSLSSNAMILSPTKDTHSHGDGTMRPAPVATFPMYMNKVAAPPGKKKFPLGRNGPCTKGGTTTLIKQSKTLLNQLMTHQHAWIFNTPVDIVKFNIPDYFNVIKHPMDLGTIKRKLLRGQYQCPVSFAADVRLTFNNAMTYNPRGSDVYLMAETMNNFFEMRWKPIEKKIPRIVDESVPSKSSVILESETGFSVPPVKEQKTSAMKHKVKQDPVKLVMSDVEKKKLGADLEAMLEELPESIIDFLKESCLNGNLVNEGEIEIDIDTISDDTLFKLRKLLDDYALEKNNQAKVEPCEIETRNESGFRKIFMQTFEGNQPADE
ncbi:transcription factor GTE10-like, partial [Olea europaea var. sylvestris]